MALPLPRLDDRSFDDLVAEARALIPGYAPGWTNFNPSDPGITLVELFAWITEILLYRMDRVSEANYRAFLDLIGVTPRAGEPVEAAVARGLRALKAPTRLVSPEDFELLAQRLDDDAVAPLVGRIRAGADVRLEEFEVLYEERATRVARATAFASAAREAAMEVVVLPTAAFLGLPADAPARVGRWAGALGTAAVSQRIAELRDRLDVFRPLTTLVSVSVPDLVPVAIEVGVGARPGALLADVRGAAARRLATFLDPYEGGEDGRGWPFGRSLFLSELYAALERVPGVDHVKSVLAAGITAPAVTVLQPHQLFAPASLAVQVSAP